MAQAAQRARARDGWRTSSRLALERLRLADGIDAGPGRVLLVARDEQQVEFAPSSGWSLERIRLEDAAASPDRDGT